MVVFNITAPWYAAIKAERKVDQSDIEFSKSLPTMPGFSIKWSYNRVVVADKKFYDLNTNFRRFELKKFI